MVIYYGAFIRNRIRDIFHKFQTLESYGNIE